MNNNDNAKKKDISQTQETVTQEPSPSGFFMALLARDTATLKAVYHVSDDDLNSINLEHQMSAAHKLLASKNAVVLNSSRKKEPVQTNVTIAPVLAPLATFSPKATLQNSDRPLTACSL